MRILVDTHAFIWWIRDDARLSTIARQSLASEENDLFLSAASAWEMAIKLKTGKLEFEEPLNELLSRFMAKNAIVELPVSI